MTYDIVCVILSLVTLAACVYGLYCALMPACKEEDDYDEFDK